MEDIKSDFSAFHRVDRIEEASCQFVIPKVKRLISYKGALRATAEREQEEGSTVKSVDGTTKQVDKVYSDPSHNLEAMQLGLFESGTG